MDTNRSQLNVTVDHATHEALQQMAIYSGATMTALIEAIVSAAVECLPDDPLEPITGSIDLAQVLHQAKVLSVERRSR